jgi:hypothetical protein
MKPPWKCFKKLENLEFLIRWLKTRPISTYNNPHIRKIKSHNTKSTPRIGLSGRDLVHAACSMRASARTGRALGSRGCKPKCQLRPKTCERNDQASPISARSWRERSRPTSAGFEQERPPNENQECNWRLGASNEKPKLKAGARSCWASGSSVRTGR